MNPLLVNPGSYDFEPTVDSPCVNAADPSMDDPDGTRRDIGACHYPFISLTCNPNEAIAVAGQFLELTLTAANELTEASFPVKVTIMARLQNGHEYPLFGPFPSSGISIPAQSTLEGVVRLHVPAGIPDGFQCVAKTMLSRSDTDEYVDMDRCDVEVSN